MREHKVIYNTISLSALITFIGILFSGPVGVALTLLVKAQPPWSGVQTFIDNYHSVQRIPFLFGFLMILGFVLFMFSFVE